MLVSPKFPHVPLGVGGWPLAYEEQRWANCQCNYFPKFPTYVILIHQRYRRTDRQTTCNCKTMLCTIVHRAVTILKDEATWMDLQVQNQI